MASNISLQQLKEGIANWKVDFPVMLFPIKIQIRFVNCMHLAKVSSSDLLVNKEEVEGQLSELEKQRLEELVAISNGETKPDEVLVPGVSLAAGQRGTQSGFPIIPDKKELWVRFFPDDIHLHTHEDDITLDEYESGVDFWKKMQAYSGVGENGEPSPNKVGQVGAWKALANGYGNSRAAWIVQATKPSNFDETGQLDPGQLNFPTAPDESVATWNEAPHSRVLPDYFALKTYKKVLQNGPNNEEIEAMVPTGTYTSNKIADYIQLSIDPQGDKRLFDQTSTGLEMPEGLKWLIDFDEAENAGMAIRIELSDEEAANGIDQIIAVGFCTDHDESASKELVEKLFENHKFKPGGMSLLAQGTPTNNTEENNSGKGLDDISPEESFDLEFEYDSYKHSSEHSEKSDGQRLVEGLQVDEVVFDSSYGNTGQDISAAIKMNYVLWHSTLGYTLPQFLFPIIDQSDVDLTCEYVVNYVIGRGYLPSIRVDDQPYGILPITRYSHFEAGQTEQNADFMNQLVQNVLLKFNLEWDVLVRKVEHLSKDLTNEDDIAAAFYRVLELQASSVTYDQQVAIGNEVALGLLGNEEDQVRQIQNQVNNLDVHFNQRFNVSLKDTSNALSYSYADQKAPLLNARKVDDFPAGEEQFLEALGEGAQNYMDWMGDVNTTFDKLWSEDFSNYTDPPLGNPPKTILYNLLRYALIRHYLLTAIKIKYKDDPILGDVFSLDFEENMLFVERESGENGAVTNVAIQGAFQTILFGFIKKENDGAILVEAFERFPDQEQEEERNNFIAEKLNERAKELILKEEYADDLWMDNKLAVLDYETTIGGETLTIKDYIDQNIDKKDPKFLGPLQSHKSFLRTLARLSNANLERLLNEHLDLGHFRLDAWLSGLANYRLDQLVQKNNTAENQGIYLGAYGLLENIRPNKEYPGVCIKTIEDIEVIENSNSPIVIPVSPDSEGNDHLGALLSNAGFVYLGDQTNAKRIANDNGAGKILPVPREDPDNQGFIPAPSMTHAVTGAVLRNAYNSHKKTDDFDDTFAINLSSSRVREAMHFIEGIENGQEIGALLGYKFERTLREKEILLSRFIYEFREKYPFEVQNINQANPGAEVDELDHRIVVDGKKLIKAYRDASLQTFLDDLKAGLPDDMGEKTIDPPLSDAHETIIINIIDQLENSLDAINDLLMAEGFYQIAAGNPDRSRAALKMLNDAGNIQIPEVASVPRAGFSITHRVGIMLPNGGVPTEWGPFINPRGAMGPRLNRYLRTKLPQATKILIRVSWVAGKDGDGHPVRLYDNIPVSKLPIQPIDLMYTYYLQRNSDGESELRYWVDNYVRKINNLTDDQFIEIHEKDRTDFDADDVHLFALDPLLMGLAKMVNSARYLKPEDLMLPTDQELSKANTHFNWKELRNRISTVFTQVERAYKDLLNRIDQLTIYKAYSKEEIADHIVAIRLTTNRLRETMMFFASVGFNNAVPPLERTIDPTMIERLLQQAKAIRKSLIKRLDTLKKRGMVDKEELKVEINGVASYRTLDLEDFREYVLDPLKDLENSVFFGKLSREDLIHELLEVTKVLMGRSFKVFPRFEVYNKEAFEQARTHDALLDHAGPFAVEEWIQSLAPVRPRMHDYLKLNMLTEMFDTSGADKLLQPVQLPYQEGGIDRWVGMEYPDDYDEIDVETNQRKIKEDTISLVFEYSDNFKVHSDYSGFVFDEWNEVIPFKEVNAGVSFNYDQPNSEAPNAILLAVPSAPHSQGAWSFEELFGAVEETIALAKKRAVDPDLIKTNKLNQFLPAVFAAINQKGQAPSLDFARTIKSVPVGQFGLVEQKYTDVQAAANQELELDVDKLELGDIFLDEDLD